MILLALNTRVRENYAFFDPSAPIDLSLSNPRGYAPHLTESILRGLRAKTLIDVENKVDIEKGVLKGGKEPKQEKREEKTATVSAISDTKETNEKIDEVIVKKDNTNTEVTEKTIAKKKK